MIEEEETNNFSYEKINVDDDKLLKGVFLYDQQNFMHDRNKAA
jgi:hypothetical protein